MAPRPAGRWQRLAPAGLLLLCLLLSVEVLAGFARWRANRDRLTELLGEPESADQGVTADGGENEGRLAAIRRIGFERTPHHAKLIAARVLVYEALGDPASGSSPVAARLQAARQLAIEALGQQPNSWQAHMFLGAATYLDRSLRSDRRLYTAAQEWERPLLQAIGEAPGQLEPRRFLAAAYLETWSALSPNKRAYATELLTAMFREDPGSFERLGPAWFEVVGDRERALEAVPDLPGPWRALEQSFAEKADWAAFCLAHGRYLEALKRRLSRDLDQAETRLRLGDVVNGRNLCLSVVAGAPVDGLFADLVTRALELFPPGLRGLSSKAALEAWLRWILDLDAIGVHRFSPRAINRLVDAIGTLDPPIGALAALIADDAYHIRRYERLAESKKHRDWAPFLIAKSSRLIDRDELSEAAKTLQEVDRSAQSSASYWLARQRLAQATGRLSDLAVADQRLAELRAKQWRVTAWRWRGERFVLELVPEARGSGLAITINNAPASGAVAQLVWDGSSVALLPVAAAEILELAIEIAPGPHVLELRSLAGGEIAPGLVQLLAI